MDLIWMTWSGLGQTHLVWKQASVQESFGPGSGIMQLDMGLLPVSYFSLGCILAQMVQIILRKTGPDPIWFWLTVSGMGQTDPVRKQAGVQESLVPLLANAFELVWTGCESDPACLMVYVIKLGQIISNYDTDFFIFKEGLTKNVQLKVKQ